MARLVQAQVCNDAGGEEGEPMKLTEEQIEDLQDQLPEGWYIEVWP